MPMAKLNRKAERGPSTEGGGFARLRDRAVGIWENGESVVRSLRLRIPPLVSLLAGSVLVLLTLYLPTTFSVDPLPGLQLASGSTDTTWPSCYLVFSPEIASTVFYLFCLLAAAFTVLFLLASVINRNLVRNRGLRTKALRAEQVARISTATERKDHICLESENHGVIFVKAIGSSGSLFHLRPLVPGDAP
jgi:hypothetical protein